MCTSTGVGHGTSITRAGLDGLKGHRNTGGMRASIYNAFPPAGVKAFVAFMEKFAKANAGKAMA